MGAAIFQGSKLIAVGYNFYGKSKPGNTCIHNGKVHNKSLHAEQMAIDQIKHYNYASKLTLYVVRLDGNGDYTCSAPCNICLDYMRKYKIKRVRFINFEGKPEEYPI
jgi:deoxycytidylate deaminase